MNKRTLSVVDVSKMAREFMLGPALKTLKEFRKDFDRDPAHAFEWSPAEFRAAARRRVALQVMEHCAQLLKHGDKAEADVYKLGRLRREALMHVLRVAKDPPRSTSQQANIMEQEIGAAWADVFNDWLRNVPLPEEE